MRRAGLLVSLLWAAACAARGPSPALVAQLGRADALVREGCHACLVEALDLYEQITASTGALASAARGAFDAALLLTIREKELGLPWEASFDRARAWAAKLPPGAGATAAAPLVEAASLVLGDTSGLEPEARARLTGRERPFLEPGDARRRALDAPSQADLVAAYLALAIDCEQPRLREAAPIDELTGRFAVPVMRFRASICGGRSADLAPLREADPRMLDTLPFEARREQVGSPGRPIDLYKAAELYGRAHEAFPASVAITMAWARANEALAEFETSLGGFDLVLAGQPTHRDALLGRVENLSYLLRHDEAIAGATRMIELGTWHVGDAYYWRAWNRYNLKQLDEAWADVEHATSLLSNTGVYTLAGLVAYGRGDRATAVVRFDRAFEIDGSNCDAVWMASLIHVEEQAWPVATPKFSKSMACYVSAGAGARADLERLEAAAQPDWQKVRQRARLQAVIKTSDERAAQSAFNAAQGYGRMGQKGPALTHVDVAIAYEPLREKALALRVLLEKLP